MIDPGTMLPSALGAGMKVDVETISGSIAQGRLPAKANKGGSNSRKPSADPVYAPWEGSQAKPETPGPQLSIDTTTVTQKPASPQGA